MNIAVDIRCLIENNYSGVPMYAFYLLKNLFKVDSKNNYYLFYNKYEDNSKVLDAVPQVRELLKFPNVELVDFHFPNKVLNFGLRFFKYPKLDKLIAKKIGEEIDLFFSPNPNFINLSSKHTPNSSPEGSTGCKFVLTIHDLSFERYPEFFAGKGNIGMDYIRGRFWHKYVGVKKLCQRADKIIAVSESTKRDLMDIYGIKDEKIKVIYEGFENTPLTGGARGGNYEQDLKSDHQEVIKKYDLPENFILSLSTLEPRKNIESIIQAFEQLCTNNYQLPATSYQLVIAGKKGWLYQDLFKLAEQSEVSDRIKFIGYVDEADKSALYQLASLFVFPAFYEGFGLPPLEAMSCGCPVITSITSSLPEVVGDAGILIDPHNINDLAEAMKMALSDDKLRQNLIQKGLERSKMFSWEKAAGESLDVFEKIV